MPHRGPGKALFRDTGPSPEGDFDPEAYDRLQKVGEWMKLNAANL